MADNWQGYPDLGETPADTDTVLLRDISNTTDNAAGTNVEITIANLLGAALKLAGGTLTGQLALGTGGSINDAGPISASGSLTRATHGGRAVLTTGNVTIPNASGDVGMGGIIILGGAHTITFNSTVTAALAAGDLFTYYVQSTTVLVRRLSAASQSVAMS